MNNIEISTTIETEAVDAGLNLDAERELFEQRFGSKDSFAWRTADGKYKLPLLQSAWEVWLESARIHRGMATADATEQEQIDLARKAAYWWDTLEKCARLLDVPVEHSIPRGVLEGVAQLLSQQLKPGSVPTIVLQTKEQAKDAIRVCNALSYVVGDTEDHPLFPIMNALMDSIGVWEDADPELQSFFGEQAPTGRQPAGTEGEAKVDDLAALVRQLVHSLKKANPNSDLAARAQDYLRRKGLAGNPLR